MAMLRLFFATLAALAMATSGDLRALGASASTTETPLRLDARIALGDVRGRIDHLALDPARLRLYVAEFDANSVAIVDLAARRVLRTMHGFDKPQGVGYEPSTDTIYVANAGDGSVRIFRGEDFAPLGKIALSGDADNVRVDPALSRVYVGYGDGAIAVIDAQTRTMIADVALEAHPEGFQLAPGDLTPGDLMSDLMFVNVPDAHQIAVASLLARRQISGWPTGNLKGNFPLAIDAENERVIAVFRQPARLEAFAMNTGQKLGGSAVCGDCDDVFVDSKRSRVYVICGEGFVDTLDATSNSFTRIGRLATSKGSRTGLFVPALDRLLIAVRAAPKEPAAIWLVRPAP